MWILGLPPLLMLLSLVAIHGLRAYVAAKVLDERQFQEFKTKGMMGTVFLRNPGRLYWEYFFVRDALVIKKYDRSRRILVAWKISFASLVFGAISFLAASAVLAAMGR